MNNKCLDSHITLNDTSYQVCREEPSASASGRGGSPKPRRSGAFRFCVSFVPWIYEWVSAPSFATDLSQLEYSPLSLPSRLSALKIDDMVSTKIHKCSDSFLLLAQNLTRSLVFVLAVTSRGQSSDRNMWCHRTTAGGVEIDIRCRSNFVESARKYYL